MTTTKLSKTQQAIFDIIREQIVRNGGHAMRSHWWRQATLDALVRHGLIAMCGDEITLPNNTTGV
jgi:hypothetical protein